MARSMFLDSFNPERFAALRTDGSVVAWGGQGTDGDTSGLMDEDLDGSVSAVREVFSINNSFTRLMDRLLHGV